ncbi:hypothetical protein [Parabacteroides sp. PF5-9]|uniref:hypothetical protein n=1 Tax=Parabacteroides sp. PF5-9 TaxID=1742404 RepID=UPI002476E3EC|nr:hypothetical protein [Parabacteroides sp. PF5-9]MDH6358595.1 hypothetical protein [Parabacteroides sp. PF5-9]
MARRKGQTMTEAQKAAMRAKKEARKLGKETAFSMINTNLKYLSFSELEHIIALASRMKKEKLGDEELKLIKEMEEIELRLKKLKELDSEN